MDKYQNDKFQNFIDDLNKLCKENEIFIAGVLEGKFMMAGNTEDSITCKLFTFKDGKYTLV